MSLLTTDEVIKKAWIVHCGKYTYPNFVYSKTYEKSWIMCLLHGPFKQRVDHHLNGSGCPKCGIEKIKKLYKDSNNFIESAIKIHKNKFDYSKIKYINSRTKVKIFCTQCKTFFYQTPNNHLQRKGCKKCAINLVTSKQKKSLEQFIQDAKDTFGDKKYRFDKTHYKNARTNVKIYCNDCKKYFYITPNNFISKKRGCQNCSPKSKGEEKIKLMLEKNNISFIQQHKFSNCKHKRPLIFDFYLPQHNSCIEYDGKQHFEIWNLSKNKEKNLKMYEQVKIRDQIKNKFCLDNNICLFRINYKQNINHELNRILNKIK